ncbi:oligopeptide-binding protein AppA precursor [Andreesenia angusta]|uniref:Oligopeptide-binding protein AppA n=1 Tax=Andreesenia angusta TaxID=39480 RepID=A0A1S1V7B1_9FIRM|nr:peptide ABC transporter substrate-binding protein [Andreesenia angusta]OHW62488.1 oligopeptide-binding protein AppA precursor [Andreesenia angusta]
MRKITAYLVLIFMTIAVVSGCSKSENGGKAGEKTEYEVAEGGEITLPLTGFETLNPFMRKSQSNYYFDRLIFEGLFSTEKNLDVAPCLAESYTMGDGARSINIVLKENLKFHDGSPLTSEDVKFTVEVLKSATSDPEQLEKLSPLYLEGGLYDVGRISEVNTKSNREVEIVFRDSFSDAPEYLTFPIVSKAALGDESKALESEDYNAVGTGPYKVEAVDSLKEVQLQRNVEYWSSKPNIETVKGKILADEELAKTSFEAGIVHAVSDLDYLEWESFAQNDKVHINSFPSNRYEFLAFNFGKDYFQGEEGKSMREAVSYGINREQILKNIYLGYGEIVDSPVNPSSWLSLKSDVKESEKYSVEKSQEILKSMGYQDRDNDGLLENEDGENISFTILAPPTSQARIDTAKSIAESLRKIGIDVEEDYEEEAGSYETEEEREADWSRFESKLMSGNYDLAVMGWEMSYLPDLSFAFHSQSSEGGNFIGYSDPELDKLMDEANRANSREAKKQLYMEIQNSLAEEKPYVSILYTNAAIINYKKISGEFAPNYMDVYSGIENWFVPKEFQNKEQK